MFFSPSASDMFTADRIQRERDEETQPSLLLNPPQPLSQAHAPFTVSSSKTRGEANRLRATHTSLKPAVTLPFLSTATKAEQYGRVVAFDRRALKRHKAHQRNAMKTTENLERVIRELTEVSIDFIHRAQLQNCCFIACMVTYICTCSVNNLI